MKRLLRGLSIGLLFCIPYFASAQVTNLKINNVSSNFSMTSGDTLKWEYNCPAGATVTGEIWYDVNGNGTIDPGTDVIRFAFTQTDGNSNGISYGPPDEDGSANGHILYFQQVGVAPGHYVFRFSQNGNSVTEAGIVLALASPAHTISGHVNPPPGKSAQNINVEINRHNGNGGNSAALNSWDAFTNASGDFQIAMNADTAGNPWDFQIQNNPYPPSILTPADTSITIVGNPAGINLTLQPAAAQVAGSYKDDSGNPLQSDVFVDFNQNTGSFYLIRDVLTDLNGLFQIGFTANEILGSQSTQWTLTSYPNGDSISTYLVPQVQLPAFHNGDSLFYLLTAFTANSTVQGMVQVNGAAPGIQYQIRASNPDSAYSIVWTDNQGNFTLKVSNKIFNYNLLVSSFLSSNLQAPAVVVHPGETGVVFNITTTSVRDASSKIPAVFALSQNYPNPFNPATEIQFTVPSNGRAVLKVFNVLGQEVATLFDGEAAVGMVHQAQFNAANLASGVYFSRLEFGGKVEMRKMLLLK